MRQRRSRPGRISGRGGVRAADVLCPWRAGRGRGATVRRPWLRDARCEMRDVVGLVVWRDAGARRLTMPETNAAARVTFTGLGSFRLGDLVSRSPGSSSDRTPVWLIQSCSREQPPTVARPRCSCCSPCAVQRDPRRPRRAYTPALPCIAVICSTHLLPLRNPPNLQPSPDDCRDSLTRHPRCQP